MSAYTIIRPDVATRAHACARGVYQAALLRGEEAWSGSTLRGKAARYSARYKASREALLARLREAGITVDVERTRPHGRIVVTIGAS